MLYRIISPLLFGFTVILSGCAYVEYMGQWPPPEQEHFLEIPYSDVPYQDVLISISESTDYHTHRKKITGTYQNLSGKTQYILSSGGRGGPLEKWNGKEWVRLNLMPDGVGYLTVISYWPLGRKEIRKFEFPEDRLIEKGIKVGGVYRFSFTICSKKEYDSCRKIYSEEFQVAPRIYTTQ